MRHTLQKSIPDLKSNVSEMGMSATEQEGYPLELLDLMTSQPEAEKQNYLLGTQKMEMCFNIMCV